MNNRKLYETIINRVAKVVKQQLNESVLSSKEADSNDIAWLSYKLNIGRSYDRFGKSYIQSLFDPDQNYAIYGITRDDIDVLKQRLKATKCISRFRTVKANSKYYVILCFKYDRSKDTERDEYIRKTKQEEETQARLAKEKFDNDVANADTDKFKLSQRDITKMKGYYNKRSDPEALVRSIKDNNKLVARWIAAMEIDWAEAVEAFEYAIKMRHVLTNPEIEAYKKKYSSVKADTSDLKKMNDNDADLSSNWITRSVYQFFNSLPYTVEWLSVWKNAQTSGGREAMHRNGRAWTEGFVVRVNSPIPKTITFDIVTNEGGGLYGYCIGNSRVMSLKDFKHYLKYELGIS